MGDPSTFTITELTGQKRKIALQGRALPYRPFTLKSKMRAELTWYPGNASATVQMLGAAEEPTVIKGQWKDRFIKSVTDDGKGVQPTGIANLTGFEGAGLMAGWGIAEDTLALVTAFDQLRRAGQLLEVTWDEIIRHGVMTSFTHSWNRREVCEWECEFAWISQGEAKQPVTVPKLPNVDDFATTLFNLNKALRDILNAPFKLAQGFVDNLFSYAEAIDEAVQDLASTVQQVSNQVTALSESGQRALSIATSVSTSASQIVTLLGSTPLRAMQNVKDLTELDVGEVLAIDQWQRGVKSIARQFEAVCAEKADDIRASINQSDLLGTFVARAPMDLRDVSTIYYDTPDEWRRLLEYNGFTSSKLERGALVQVPKLQAAASDRRT